MKAIGIVGYGYVGRAFYEFFKNHFKVLVYDNSLKVQENFSDIVSSNFDDLKEVDLFVICVPTPFDKINNCVDISMIESSLEKITESKLVLIKSTIPPNTTKILSKKNPHLRLVFSPEYVGESSYYLPPPYNFNEKVVETPFFIFGGDKKDSTEIIDFFIQIAGPVKNYIQTDSTNAEICKYMENLFFATKIIFCNEFNEICKHFGADYNEVRELWLQDNRITKMHTIICNKDKPYAFGGKCLPKDLDGFIGHVKGYGYEPSFLRAVQKANASFNNSSIFMLHRINTGQNPVINPLYFDRKMVLGIHTLEYFIESKLKYAKFGSLEECIQNPDKYFCLSFDDGFKEHLKVAKHIIQKYGAKKESLLFSINISNSLDSIFCGMDIIYSLILHGKIKDIFYFFELELQPKSLLENIQILKQHYIKQSPKILKDFYYKFEKYAKLQETFLDSKEIQELSKIATICSHSILHRDLREFKNESFIEISESKKILENLIQDEVNIFCYPEGKSDAELQEFCKNSSFKYGVNTRSGGSGNFDLVRKDV